VSAYAYRLVNVFTTDGQTLTGNPLCVFENGTGLDGATMQALALQFNLSETTFLLPSTRASARVRIFTPAYEMAFAGHPTLGTAHVCRVLGIAGSELTLEMQAGLIAVRANGNRWTLEAQPPTAREVSHSRAQVAAMLGLEPPEVGERPLWVKAGREQLIVPLASEEAVRRAFPRAQLLAQLASEDGASMAYVFAPAAAGRLLARFFFPKGPALLEDPATGSATANLGGWCLAMGRAPPFHFEIAQGAQTGRPSTLYLDVDAERCIRVSGDVIELGRGSLEL
jgi:trans-2,3-dihydro-3-hydroxyanthranilate isomerase